MPTEINQHEIERAVGKEVEIIAYGIPYRGTLREFDHQHARLILQDGPDTALLDLDRIESFKRVGA